VAKGRPVALAAAALANGQLPASQSATVRNATEPANAVVMFVAVLARLKRPAAASRQLHPFRTTDDPFLISEFI
jgi:hypothetical protein